MKKSSVCKSRFRLIIQASNAAWIKGVFTTSNIVKVQLQAQSFNVMPYFDLEDKSHLRLQLPRGLPIYSFAHDCRLSLARDEYGQLNGSPNTNSYRRNQPLQLSIQCAPQYTHKQPSSEPHGAT
jgi:hypothetical protein